jgi:hypothetical protein
MSRAAALAVVWTTGCSLFMTAPPPMLTPVMPPDCSSSRAAPIVDLIGAGATAYTGLAIYAISAAVDELDGEKHRSDSASLFAALIGIGGTAAYLASAVHGFSVASDCRAATSTWYLTLAPNAPNPVGPPLPPPGSERAACRLPPGPPCDPGLTCAAGRCVLVAPFAPPQ